MIPARPRTTGSDQIILGETDLISGNVPAAGRKVLDQLNYNADAFDILPNRLPFHHKRFTSDTKAGSTYITRAGPVCRSIFFKEDKLAAAYVAASSVL